MTSKEEFLERAEGCRYEAERTNLPNVRDQCLRAAAAWESMAARLQLAESYRADEAVRKGGEPAWRSAPRPHR
jgi:hypothetical protein